MAADQSGFLNLDYLTSYIRGTEFDVPKLINDDFFRAIKLLSNEKLYVSASKLLLVFIDAIAFVAYSDSSAANFKKWLDAYVDLKSHGLTSEEVWEHRNALLHFTSLDSRKTKNGTIRRCMAYVGRIDAVPASPTGEAWYNFHDLLFSVIAGLEKFLNDFLPKNIETFIRNYDEICSDTRYLVIEANPVVPMQQR